MKIQITDDFDLYKIAYSGQCFRVKELDENTFSFITKDNKLIMRHLGDCEYEVSCDDNVWKNVWHNYFDLDTCYANIRAQIPSSDTYLTNAANIGKGIRILKQDKFEMLISFIISQRKRIPAIKSSVEKLCTLYGVNGSFPTASALFAATYEELSSCSLGYRTPYIQDTVQKIVTGEIKLDELDLLSDEDIIEALKTFKGVGDKVANCVALFAYHRTALAPIDTWINKVIATQYNGTNPFSKYGKYAGVMQQYMFYAAQHEHALL